MQLRCESGCIALDKRLDFGLASDYEGNSLMNFAGSQGEDRFFAVDRDAASLLCDEGQRIGLIEQTQLPRGMGMSRGIEENASFENGAMKVCDQRANIPGAICPSCLPVPEFLKIPLIFQRKAR